MKIQDALDLHLKEEASRIIGQRAGIDFTGSKVGYRYLELLRVSEVSS